MNQESGWRVFGILLLPLVLSVLAVPVRAVEVTLQNDSLAEGQAGNIQAGFIAGESAASW